MLSLFPRRQTLVVNRLMHRPDGIIRDSVVAEADLMTLFSGLELGAAVCFSVSPESSRWRALRAARSLMAFGVDGESLSAAPFAAPPVPPLLPLARSDTSPELPAALAEENAGIKEQKPDGVSGVNVKTFKMEFTFLPVDTLKQECCCF